MIKKFQLNQFINIGLHLGGDILKNTSKPWGTYDLNLITKRYNKPLYNVKNIWRTIQNVLFFINYTNKSLNIKIFFGSLSNRLFEILEEASGRCNATFYGDSDEWIYGQYTNFLIEDRVDIVYLPDIINNQALFNEFDTTLSAIIGIRTTDSMPNIDYPLIGDSNNLQHVVYYTHLLTYTLIKSK